MTREKEDEARMLQQIWEEIRYVRAKLDAHVKDEDESVIGLRKDMQSIKEELTGHKVKLGIMFSGIGIVLTAFAAWAFGHIDKIR